MNRKLREITELMSIRRNSSFLVTYLLILCLGINSLALAKQGYTVPCGPVAQYGPVAQNPVMTPQDMVTTQEQMGDVAFYEPGIQGMMTIQEQTACADHLYQNLQTGPEAALRSKVTFHGYSQKTIDLLVGWINARMSDGQQDILVIIDMCPRTTISGEKRRDLWLRNG